MTQAGKGRRLMTAAVAIVCATLLGVSAAAAPATAARRVHVRSLVLSNERTLSRWAEVMHAVLARRAPSARARSIMTVPTLTGDGTPNVALALRERVEAHGDWVLIRLARRPNDEVGWVPRRALGRLHVVRTLLVIDREHLVARLYRSGREVWRSPVGVGKPSTPTPSGHFFVRERLLPTDPSGLYGTFAFGTSAYSPVLTDWPEGGVVGIHGTNEPQIIPGYISHGCVRVPNPAINRLRGLMPLGTPIWIR